MRNLVEPRVRRLVADQLGVEEADLGRDTSLVEDLAADSLDLCELAIALEEDLHLPLPDTVVTSVRTYGDLVDEVIRVVHAHVDRETRRSVPPPAVCARIVRPGSAGRVLEHSGPLTPYAAETIADDAIRLGTGTRLEITVSAAIDDGSLVRVRDAFAALPSRGILVHVQRDADAPGRSQSTAA